MTRAGRRLEIARQMLNLPEGDTLAHIKTLPKERQDRLKACVDWVEEYEREESEKK